MRGGGPGAQGLAVGKGKTPEEKEEEIEGGKEEGACEEKRGSEA